MRPISWLLALAALGLLSAAVAQDRNAKVLGDRDRVQAGGFWIYNDLPKGFEQARKTRKPLLVVFRCIPCEHCAQLDQSVVERDKTAQKLLEQFVCVRIVHANGMDLSLFQFDYDQSWTVFFLNADRTIYGRYGTRSHQTESAEDMSLAGFTKALQGALELHRQYPKNRTALTGKQGAPAEVTAPEEFPSLKAKYGPKLDYGPNVVQSCMHCHQVREAQREVYRLAGQAMPASVLYPYPNPKILGLVMDPVARASVRMVRPDSPAAQDGFKTGDEIVTISGQPILSTADIQWVLHNAPPTGSLKAEVRRSGKVLPLTLTLGAGWRQRDSISWRATSWDLRRMATGGLLLEEAPAEERRQAGLADTALALRVRHVGEYGAHAAAKQAGFKQGDVLVKVDGRSERMTESDLLAYLVNQKKAGEKVACTVFRKGERLDLSLPMQ